MDTHDMLRRNMLASHQRPAASSAKEEHGLVNSQNFDFQQIFFWGWVFQKAPENAIAPANLQTLCSLASKKCEGMQVHTEGTASAPGRSAIFWLRRARKLHLAVDMAEPLIAAPASPASPSALFEGERGPLGVTRFRGARNPWMKRALQGTLGCNTSTGQKTNNIYIYIIVYINVSREQFLDLL